jgi:hypothetical protein
MIFDISKRMAVEVSPITLVWKRKTATEQEQELEDNGKFRQVTNFPTEKEKGPWGRNVKNNRCERISWRLMWVLICG